MDKRSEDTMVKQIERNLSNNINDNLFLTGRAIDNRMILADRTTDKAANSNEIEGEPSDYPLVSHDYINHSLGISRAEYIHQAREACLRQLSAQQIYTKPYDINYNTDQETDVNEQQNSSKRGEVMRLFHNVSEEDASKKDVSKDMASYHSLIIRSVCAILLFLLIFIFDKFNIKLGDLTNNIIEDYVTGKDAMQYLENFMVTWLK